MSSAPTQPGFAQYFSQLLDGLRALLAARISRPKTAGQLAAIPLMLLLWHRLGRLKTRFAALAARTSWVPRPLRPKPTSEVERPARPKDRLPTSIAWLIRLLPHEAAVCGSQLQHVMSQPDMVALLEASPQARRLLRPLCRMLGQPEPARSPRRTRPPVPAPDQAAGPPTTAEPPDPAPPHRPPPPMASRNDADRLQQRDIAWPSAADAPA